MKILNNPILGKIFAGSSLTLNDDGLYRKIETKYGIYKIFLTNNVRKIVEILELDFDLIDKSSTDECYELIIDSPHFSRDCFRIKGEASHSIIIAEFAKYLEDVKPDGCPGNPIRTEKLENILNIELRDVIDDVKRILSTPRVRLSGVKLLPYLGKYDKRNFNKHIKAFIEQFDCDYAYQCFLTDNTYEDIAKLFKTVNKLK